MGANVTADNLNGRLNRGRVLLVTDEAARSASVATQLETAGFTIIAVGGGVRAVVAFSRAAPHIVILDVALKVVGAGELTRMMVNRHVDGGEVPVILVGEWAATAERQGEAIASGAFDYFHLPADLPLLTARTAQLVALKQKMNRLYVEANSDMLTGLANRRLFRSRLGREMELWRRNKWPSSLLSVDIDHMKRINDRLGHSAGDRAIRHVADALAEVAGENDLASRLGGEEFALLLPGADQSKAVTVAERVRRIISAAPVEGVGLITVSIGVASCPTHGDSERKLYEAADAALYRAKNEGRDRSVVATPISPGEPPGE
jgi:diguanylate cyclase (GGDEF)-like protein